MLLLIDYTFLHLIAMLYASIASLVAQYSDGFRLQTPADCAE